MATLTEAFYADMLPHSERRSGRLCRFDARGGVDPETSSRMPVPSLQAVKEEPPNIERSPWSKSYIKKPFGDDRGQHHPEEGNLDGPGLGVETDDNLIDNELRHSGMEVPGDVGMQVDGSAHATIEAAEEGFQELWRCSSGTVGYFAEPVSVVTAR